MLCSSVAEGATMLEVLPDEPARSWLKPRGSLSSCARKMSPIKLNSSGGQLLPVGLGGCSSGGAGVSLELHRVDVARQSFRPEVPAIAAPWSGEGRSKILVLSTESDFPADVLGCGEALSTVLLECTMAGMATCPLTHLVELDDSRDIIRTLVDEHREPRVLIRVGIAPPIEVFTRGHTPAAARCGPRIRLRPPTSKVGRA